MRTRKSVPRVRGTWWWQQGFRVWASEDMLWVSKTDRFGKPCRPFVCVPDGVDPAEGAWLYVEGLVCEMLRKPEGSAAGDRPGITLVDVKFKKDYPTLWDYLTQQQWDDGSARETAGLTMFVQDGLFKALLKDNDAGQCLWVAAHGFFDVLAALEKQASAPVADWRVDRKRPALGGKKR